MTPDRWHQVEQLYHAALEKQPGERTLFLDEACRGDDTLRSEVDSLLAQELSTGAVMGRPVWEDAAEVLGERTLTVVRTGTRLGPYEILGPLGSGGMGWVYQARDSRLGRLVAIKVSKREFDARFQRERRAISALNHPNICTLYDVGPNYLVMELVEGETLAARIRAGPLPVDLLLRYGAQIADALAAAHAQGVIHRDLKPGNIMVTRAGVKVLDFGLAKFAQTAAAPEDRDALTAGETVLGTPPYMSPEQARGEELDERSDIFSLGSVLYAAATGHAPFRGENTLAILHEVATVDPPPASSLRQDLPAEFDAILKRAQAKDKNQRFRSASELAAALEELRGSGGSPHPYPLPAEPLTGWQAMTTAIFTGVRRHRRVAAANVLAILVLAAAAFAVWSFGRHRPSPEALRWYDEGARALRDGTPYRAMKAFERAVQLDPSFNLAHARLAEAATELFYMDKAQSEMLQASPPAFGAWFLLPAEKLRLEAVYFTLTRDFAQAAKKYRQLLDKAPQNEKSAVLVDLGRAYEAAGDLRAALASYTDSTKRDKQYAAAFLRRGALYGRRQELKQAAADFDTAEQLYQTEANVEGLTEVAYQRHLMLRRTGKLAEARPLAERSLAMARQSGDEYHQIRALLALSYIDYNQGDTPLGQRDAEQGVELARRAGIEPLAASGLVDVGTALFYKGDNAAALPYLQDALGLARQHQSALVQARGLLILGQVLLKDGRKEEGLAMLKQAGDLLQKAGFRSEAARALIPIGRALRDKGDYDAAATLFHEQIPLAEQVNDQAGIALAEQGLGSVLMLQERYPAALRSLDRSLAIYRGLSDQLGIGYTLPDRGKVLASLGQYREAETALDEAESYALRFGGLKPLLAGIHTFRAEMRLSQRLFTEAAVESRKVLDNAGDDLTSAANAKRILGLAAVFSGRLREGKAYCEDAVKMAGQAMTPEELEEAQLAVIESRLAGNDAAAALVSAGELASQFASKGQTESEWHALMLAARAARQPGVRGEYILRANAALQKLRANWGQEALDSYLSRPDVRWLRQQVEQLHH